MVPWTSMWKKGDRRARRRERRISWERGRILFIILDNVAALMLLRVFAIRCRCGMPLVISITMAVRWQS